MNTKMSYMRLGMLILLASAVPLCAQQQTKPPAQTPQAPASGAAPAPGAPPAAAAPAVPAAQAKPAVPPDKVVMKVGDQEMTAAQMQALIGGLPPQVQRMVATQGPRNVGEQYALMLALSAKAVSDHLDQDPEYTQRIKLQERQMLAQAEYKKIGADIKVTPDDISQYFTAHKSDFDQVEIRKITVRKKAADAKPGMPGLSAAEARAKAEEIRKALVDGGDPAKLADTYKTPPGAVYIETTPRAVRRGNLQAGIDAKVFDLKDGEITDIQENPQSFYFTQVAKHSEAQLSDASQEIETKLKEEKVQAAIDAMKTSSNVWLDPDYFGAPPAPPTPAPVPAPAGAPAAKPATAAPSVAPPTKPPVAPPSN
jgi:hypothetical protein